MPPVNPNNSSGSDKIKNQPKIQKPETPAAQTEQSTSQSQKTSTSNTRSASTAAAQAMESYVMGGSSSAQLTKASEETIKIVQQVANAYPDAQSTQELVNQKPYLAFLAKNPSIKEMQDNMPESVAYSDITNEVDENFPNASSETKGQVADGTFKRIVST